MKKARNMAFFVVWRQRIDEAKPVKISRHTASLVGLANAEACLRRARQEHIREYGDGYLLRLGLRYGDQPLNWRDVQVVLAVARANGMRDADTWAWAQKELGIGA